MVSKGGSRRDEGVGKGARRDSSSNDEEDSDEEEPEQPVSKFVLPGDDTGSGIDYHIQDDDSWQTLQAYCKVNKETFYYRTFPYVAINRVLFGQLAYVLIVEKKVL